MKFNLFSYIALSFASLCIAIVEDDQYNALRDIYTSTDGDNWTWSDTDVVWDFNSTQDPCIDEWADIICSGNRIVTLDLQDKGLSGSLPNSIGYMTDLQTLSIVRSPNLIGKIPGSIKNLTKLEVFTLISVGIFDQFPNEICYLPYISKIEITNSGLYGYIPSCIADLSALLEISLVSNQLFGTIPLEIFGMSQLRTLELSGNFLNGTIPSLIKMSDLITLDLSKNRGLLDSFPTGFCQVHIVNGIPSKYARLTVLDLSETQMRGSLPPEELACLRFLTELRLDNDHITGSIPPEIKNMQRLKLLSIRNNEFSGTFPIELFELRVIQYVDIAFNSFDGPFPYDITEELASIRTLNYLDISWNFISSTLPAALQLAYDLKYLDCSHNLMTGPLPLFINTFEKLGSLKAQFNMFSGAIPYIGSLINLKALFLSSNLLSGFIPKEVFQIQSLVTVALQRNRFSGTLPEISQDFNSSMVLMKLAFNTIGGSIPESFRYLRRLKYLSFQNNNFTGIIPESLYDLTNLVNLDMDLNELSGSISNQVGNLKDLVVFTVGINQLTSTIPKEFSLLKNLNYFSAGGNKLTGTIPKEMATLNELNAFFVYDNYLEGPIPNDFAYSLQLLEIYVNNNILSSTIPVDLFSEWTNAADISMASNAFGGQIPESIYFTASSQLASLNFSDNLFTGSVSLSVCDNFILQYLDFSNNQLEGRIPDCFTARQKYLEVILSSNMLTGTIPATIGDIELWFADTNGNFFARGVSNIELHSNLLTGVIPSSLVKLKLLKTLLLQSNYLTGNLDDFFSVNSNSSNSSVMSRINQWDVSSNQLSGTLPRDLFYYLPTVVTFAASENCFTGKFPTSLCEATYLQDLILMGLCKNSECKRKDKILYSLRNILDLDSFGFSDSIPSCLFTLPSLQKVYLTGNTLYGTVPSDFRPFEFRKYPLFDISINHNRLTGPFPWKELEKSFSTAHLINFDISHNRLCGSFESEADSNILYIGSSLRMNNNRFTGYIPRINNDSHDNEDVTVHLFPGNMFDCDRQHPKPAEDYLSDTYLCGSSFYDTSLQYCGAQFFVTIVCVVAAYYIWHMKIIYNNVEREITKESKFWNNKYIVSMGNAVENIILWNRYEVILRSTTAESQLIAIGIRREILVGATETQPQNVGLWLRSSLRSDVTTDVMSRTYDSYHPSFSNISAQSVRKLHDSDIHMSSVAGDTIPSKSADQHVVSMNDDNKRIIAFAPLYLQDISPSSTRPSTAHSSNPPDIESPVPIMENPMINFRMTSDSDVSMNSFREDVIEGLDELSFPPRSSERERSSTNCSHMTETTSIHSLRHIRMMLRVLHSILCMCFILCIAIIVLSVPGYLILKTLKYENGNYKYSTTTAQYSWIISSAFLTGLLPAIYLSVLLYVVVALLIYVVLYFNDNMFQLYCHEKEQSMNWLLMTLNAGFGSSNNSNSNNNSRSPSESAPSARNKSHQEEVKEEYVVLPKFAVMKQIFFKYCIYLFDAAVVLLVNSLYVTAVAKNSSTVEVKYILQFVLALFRTLWGNLMVPTIVSYMSKLGMSSTQKARALLIISIFDSLIAPCFATLISDSNCFYENLHGTQEISTTYSFEYCKKTSYLSGACIITGTATYVSNFYPSPDYNYQCASAILTNYAPVLLYTNALFSLIVPLIFFILSQQNPNTIPRFVGKHIPYISWPLENGLLGMHILRPEIIVSSLQTNIVILASFGLACPPLGLVVAIAIACKIYFWKIFIVRYVDICYFRANENKFAGYTGTSTEVVRRNRLKEDEALYAAQCHSNILILNDTCRKVWQVPRSCLYFSCTICVAFFCFFVGDTAGDENDTNALIVGLSVGLTAFILIWLCKVYRKFHFVAVDQWPISVWLQGVIPSVMSADSYSEKYDVKWKDVINRKSIFSVNSSARKSSIKSVRSEAEDACRDVKSREYDSDFGVVPRESELTMLS